VLPRINTQNRTELANDGVLVGICLDLDSASLRVLDQPSPTTSLDARECRVELVLEGVEATVAVVDGS
jgi:hypothetical protein